MLSFIKTALTTLRSNRLFLWITVVPSFLSIIYFSVIASDVYVSESRFVVRSPENQTQSPFGQLLKGAVFSKAADDSYVVQDYVLSRDALMALDKELKVKEAYSSSSIDLFSRFSPMGLSGDSFESFHAYFQRKVTVMLDSSSSISTLTVRAYSAEDSYKINRRLVELAEVLVNRLNERGRRDMIAFATDEVISAQGKAKEAGLALAAYRNDKGVIDPEKQTAIPLQQVAKLQEELLEARTQVRQLEKLAKDNPQLPVLRQRVSILENEIEFETRRVAGGEKSLANKATEYQRLLLEKEFADKMLASAMSTLEQAKNEAQRKQLYLERVVQPNIPDEALEPKRLRNILVTLILSGVVWGILSLLVAGVKEHNE